MKALRAVGAPERQPEIISVILADLYIDHEHYQRPLIPTSVDALCAEFDARAAGIFAVNLRENNVIALVDGQHRMQAARRLGYRTWPAYAYTGLSIREEAALFLRLQSLRRQHSAFGKWRAHIAAGSSAHITMESIVASFGFRVDVPSKNPRVISCPDTLLIIAGKNQRREIVPDRVRVVLDFIVACWPSDPLGLNTRTLLGVDHFLRKYAARLDMVVVQAKFRMCPLDAIHRRALTIRDANRTNMTRAVSIALQQEYDAKRRTQRLEPVTATDID